MKVSRNLYIPLILIAVAISIFSNFGMNYDVIEVLTFTKGYSTFNYTYIEESEWWRLISPIFMHFSIAHLAFNCLWIYVLGEKIEMIDGKITFILIIVISSILSNFFQYYSQGPHVFGGLSGVVYGLLGFCMIIEMESKFDRYGLPPALYLFMVIWLILGFMGILDLFGFGKIANFAHLGGLVSGILFAMIYKIFMKKLY